MNRDPVSERSAEPFAAELFAAARKESPSEETRQRIVRALRAQSEPQDAWHAWIPKHRRRISFALLSAAAAALTLVLLQSPETVDISAESLAQKSTQKPTKTENAVSKPTVATPPSTDKVKTSPKISSHKVQPQTPTATEPTKAPQAPPSLDQELAGMQKARSALKAGDAAAALTQLAQFGEKPGWRQLQVEASLLRIEALFELGKADESRAAEARTEALRFVEAHPNNPLVDRAAKFTRPAPSSHSIPSSQSTKANDSSESAPSERE